MTDRLTEIETRTVEDMFDVQSTNDTFYSKEYLETSIVDRFWLIARVRELEAQAALDAEVRDAARELCDVLRPALAARDAEVDSAT